MPFCDTVDKMADPKLTKENMIAPWAPRSLNNVLFGARARAPSLNRALDSGSSMAPIEINVVLGSRYRHVAIYLQRTKLMGNLLILDEFKILQ